MKILIAVLLIGSLFTGYRTTAETLKVLQVQTVQDKMVINIPNDVMKTNFGPKHPFRLTVKGPSPVFKQSGYTFKVDIGSFSLYDPLYYDVPVYIDIDSDYGTKLPRLYTTDKARVSVGLIILNKN